MDEQEYEELIQVLNNSIENFIPIEFINEQLNSNYLDINENTYFHYLSKYTFKEYCLHNYKSEKNEIISNTKYIGLSNQYLEKIISFVNILININCDINHKNIFDQSPLEMCLINKNYNLAKEYSNYVYFIDFLLENNNIDLIFNNNILNEEYIDFIITLFHSNNNEKLPSEIKNNFLNKQLNKTEMPPLIYILKDYNNNIYKKFIQIIKINLIEYLKKGPKGEYILFTDENTKNKILEKSMFELNSFCLSKFYIIIDSLINFGADINYIEKYTSKKDISAFMYLMAYPCLPDLTTFITKNNIYINYQDYFGRTPLMHLINNKNNIIKINENIYRETFNNLISNEIINLSLRDNNGISAFLLCLINENYDDAKKIYYQNLDKFISEFKFDILILLIIKIYGNEFNDNFLLNFQNVFQNEINYDLIDSINERTLLHYFFMFITDINENYLTTINKLMKLVVEKNKKDIYKRNCLFYLFIDFCGDPKKNKDPFELLDYCLKNKLFEIYLNDKDILGNDLLIYATRCGFIKSVEILIFYGAILNDSKDNEGNNIYSIALMSNENLFFYLYNLKKINFDINQKINVFSTNFDSFLESKKESQKQNNKNNINNSEQNTQVLNMYDFFHDPELILFEGYEVENNIMNNKYNKLNLKEIENKSCNNKEKNDMGFTIFDFLNQEQKKVIDNYIKDNFNLKFENTLKKISLKIDDLINLESILENPKYFIKIINTHKKCIFFYIIFKYYIKYVI